MNDGPVTTRLRVLLPIFALCGLGGCGASSVCSEGGARVLCEDGMAKHCDGDGTLDEQRDCAAEGLACIPDIGCSDACNRAIANNSYIGCDYWAVPTTNSQLAPEFEFAIVVANPRPVPVDITVEQQGDRVATETVTAEGLEIIRLPWASRLRNGSNIGSERSALVRDIGYHVQSDFPVTVYQFNPLNFRRDEDCTREPQGQPTDDGQCFSFSNDASLLLPTHVLSGRYIAMSRRSMLLDRSRGATFGRSPGFITIVGVEERPVEVEARLTARIAASGEGSVAPLDPGETGRWTLRQGDVLQIVTEPPEECPEGSPRDSRTTYCDVSDRQDLTGTEIEADGKVAVISGHNCALVPFDKFACDHLEQQMFPLETWGQDYVVSATEPLAGEPNLLRVVSGADDNLIRFEPASIHEEARLDRGEKLELRITRDVRVRGSDALMVGQFLVGQNYNRMTDVTDEAQGDPSMSLAIPSEQRRSQYTFLAPTTFPTHFVNVSAAEDQPVVLDGDPIDGWRPVGDGERRTARVPIDAGVHKVQSDGPFGIVVYGFGSFTSYMYPGGLDFAEINPPPI